MRRPAIAIAALLLLFAASKMYSLGGDGGQYHTDITDNYYSDDSYSMAIGWDERDCSGASDSAGSTSDWRYREVTTCDDGSGWGSCQEYQPGNGWVNVSCPDPGVTAQHRIHVPGS